MDSATSLPAKKAAFSRDWTKGSTIRNLFSLSWPITSSFGIYQIGSLVDMLWVGRLGSAAMAAVGTASMAIWLGLSAVACLTVGIRALIARFIGAGDSAGATHVARQALLIAAVYGVLVATVSAVFATPILRLFGVDETVIAEGAVYLRICAVSAVSSSLWMILEATMQASGDVIRPLAMTISSKVVHMCIEPVLIFGWAFVPAMGIRGAAITIAVTETVGMIAGFFVMFTGRTRLKLSLTGLRIDLKTMWRIIRIGIPALLMNVQGNFAGVLFMRLIAPFGTLAVAAQSLYMKVEQIALAPMMGFGMAAAVLVGQNLGARQPQRAERSGWLAVGLAEAIMVGLSLALIVFARQIVGLFDAEPGLTDIAVPFLRIAAAGYVLAVAGNILQNCCNGAGDTLPPTLGTLLSTWAVQIPFALLLPRVGGLGVLGIRWAMVIGWGVSAVIFVVYFRIGRWKRKRV